MSANLNVSWSASWNNKKKGEEKRGLTAQEEYWLNRILRDHAKQIYVIVTLFLLIIAGAIVVAIKNGGQTSEGGSYSIIEIKGGK